jgi:hypothetical protein
MTGRSGRLRAGKSGWDNAGIDLSRVGGTTPMAEANAESIAVDKADLPDRRFFDLGHQGDFDRTQIAARLAMTPTQRLRCHESWRLFIKETLRRAELRRANHRGPG